MVISAVEGFLLNLGPLRTTLQVKGLCAWTTSREYPRCDHIMLIHGT
jgi:hypothetical protein